MTDPWCCYIWCAMDPINKKPSHVSINIQENHGSVMGNGKCLLILWGDIMEISGYSVDSMDSYPWIFNTK